MFLLATLTLGPSGDRVPGRDQLASASDALRHRPALRARAARHILPSRPPGRRGQPRRPSGSFVRVHDQAQAEHHRPAVCADHLRPPALAAPPVAAEGEWAARHHRL